MTHNSTDTPFGPPDPTPAVEHAAKAIVREEGILEWDGLSERLRDHPRGLARAALNAALDIQEMARALWDCPAFGSPTCTWDELADDAREHWLADARAIRTAILGDEA